MRSKAVVLGVALLGLLAVAPAGAEPQDPPPPRSEGAPAPAPEAALSGLVEVRGGYYVSCGRTTSGQVRCWGWNDRGELGNGNDDAHDFAVPVRSVADDGNLTGVTQIAVGDHHACALLTSHQVRCWGENTSGQLGNGHGGTHSNLPVSVRNDTDTANLTNVRQIGAESNGTCALLTTDQVRCWGDDDGGQLGNDAPNSDVDLPVAVKNVAGTGPLSAVRSIEMGRLNNCAVLNNGQGRCWGDNSAGALGTGDLGDSDYPVVVTNAADTGPLSGIAQISIGGSDACARLSNGQARCWGENAYGEVGDGTNAPRHRPVVVRNASGSGPLINITQIDAGTFHTCALLSTGQVRCWGEPYYGELADGTPLESEVIRRLPRVAKINPSTPLSNVRQIAGNYYTTCALLRSGRARCWGFNNHGQVGNGGTVDRRFATTVLV